MPLSNVHKVKKLDDTTLDVTVEVAGYEAGAYVHVSGHATQSHGAFATFAATEMIPTPEYGTEVPEISLVSVTAHKSPDTKEFDLNDPITVVAQLTWMRVLAKPDPDDGRTEPDVWLPQNDGGH